MTEPDIKYYSRIASDGVEALDMNERCADDWPVVTWRPIELLGTPQPTEADIIRQIEETE